MQVAVGHLGGKDDGDPAVQCGLHLRLCGEDVRIASRIDHEGDAHGLDGLVDPGVGEHEAFVRAVGFAAIGLGGFDEVIKTAIAFAGRDIGAFALRDAVRDPVDNERFGAGVPERTIDGIAARVDDVEALRGWGRFGVHVQCGCLVLALACGCELENVLAGGGEGCCCDGCGGCGEGHGAGAGEFGPAGGIGVVIAEPDGLAGEVCFAADDDRAIDAGVDQRGQRGHVAGIEDAPLENAGCMLIVR